MNMIVMAMNNNFDDDEYDLKGLWEGADVDYLLVVDD